MAGTEGHSSTADQKRENQAGSGSTTSSSTYAGSSPVVFISSNPPPPHLAPPHFVEHDFYAPIMTSYTTSDSKEKFQDIEANPSFHPQTHNHANGIDSNGASLNRQPTAMMPAFGGAFQPAPYKPSFRKFANPAPLGLCAFALTTFVLSLINVRTRGVAAPNIVVGAAYAYGGLIQLLAGMWEMAVGNTFGATALSSYGGFWIAWAIIETSSFGIGAAYEQKQDLNYALGFFLAGWFIFTFMCFICTLKSTLAFSALFFFLDLTFLLLTVAHFQLDANGASNVPITKAAGVFGLITAFIAWWNAMAGMLEKSNSFFIVPVAHFPWSEKVKNEKAARSD